MIGRHSQFAAELMRPALLCLTLFAALTGASAQEGSSSDPRRPLGPEDTPETPAGVRRIPYFSPKQPTTCEVTKAYLNDAAGRASDLEGTHLIVVARPGSGETSPRLNRERLKIVMVYLKRYPELKVVGAEGESVKGLGRVEVYVGGKLLYTIPIKKNHPSVCISQGPEARGFRAPSFYFPAFRLQ